MSAALQGLEPERVIADLRELASLSSDERGAQRVAFTKPWLAARAWLRDRLSSLPVEVAEDDAQNLWATLRGDEDPPVAVGSHLDSVPDGGWLDGTLGVLAGLEILRAAGSRPARSLTLVDWADEEGRFGHSLLGSCAAFGTLDVDALRAGGAGDVLDLEKVVRARERRPDLHAYLELHIEQGPVLEEADEPLAAVRGTCGVRRRRLSFTGSAAHAGATPLALRRDPVLAGARFVVDARRLGVDRGALVTVGVIEAQPATPTAVARSCRLVIDARHEDRDALRALEDALLAIARRCAESEHVAVTDEALWAIDPIAFEDRLVRAANEAVQRLGSSHRPMVSGPLHDAAQPARAGIPTAMIFVRSRGGISHSADEDSSEEDLELGVRALAGTVASMMG
jgi:hydantoinase/carbamoylase family amidase